MILPTTPMVAETNIGKTSSNRPQGSVLHLGPHGRWAEVPALQLLAQQVWVGAKIFKDLRKSAPMGLESCPKIKRSHPKQLVNLFQDEVWHLFLRHLRLKLQRECLADGNALQPSPKHSTKWWFNSPFGEQLGAGNHRHSSPTSSSTGKKVWQLFLP